MNTSANLCASFTVAPLSLSILLTPFFANADMSHYTGSGAVTQGSANITVSELFQCEKARARPSAMGEITDMEGNIWIVPAENHYTTAPHAINMYDECSGNTPSSLSEIDTTSIPVITVDEAGEVITGYIFADNYFELYINGKLIVVDDVPFTPFNSSIVKFKVSKPYTIAFKLIDWEEHLGLGSERGRGKTYQPGDGGLIASFSDGTVTSEDWKAQTFYTSPIYDLSCLKEEAHQRSSTDCDTSGSNNAEGAYGIHWPTPDGWTNKEFNASSWPQAVTYTEEEIGVDNKNGYMNFREKFIGAGAAFIWSSNLILDNEVLIRYQVK